MNQSLTRRNFLKTVGAMTAAVTLSDELSDLKVNKREIMLSLLDMNKKQNYTPGAFFLHFDKSCHQGQAAIDKHLEYFRYTGMDFVKIQYERTFPPRLEIKKPEDWKNMPLYKLDFYEPQLGVVKGLVKAAKKEALVLITLYSPFMCAGHTTSDQLITEHIKENPEAVKKGMEIVTESVLLFAKECIKLGVDGFYASTQGGESGRFGDPRLFNECIKQYDLEVMKEINRSCIFNILHICDYNGIYDDLSRFLDYPGHVVNCNPKLKSKEMTLKEISKMFKRPYMGGMDRKGIIASGSKEAIKREVEKLLKEAPDKYVLGADCTLPGDIDWDTLRTVISMAHGYSR